MVGSDIYGMDQLAPYLTLSRHIYPGERLAQCQSGDEYPSTNLTYFR